MSFESVSLRFLLGVVLLSLACSSPTTNSPEPSARTGERALGLATTLSQSGEEFDCTRIEDVAVRFSDPGFVQGNRAGLYVKYEGAPPGEKLLRIWWNREKDPTIFEDHRLGEGEPQKDGLFDLEKLLVHVYPNVFSGVTVLVRAELILIGQTGNCARNRSLTLEATVPPEETPPSPPPGPCAGFRFCDLGDGTVRDTATGHVWLKDAGCFGLRRWLAAVDTTAQLSAGRCGLADGSSPGDWRLPSPEEVSSLLDDRFVDPKLSNARGDAKWSDGDAFTGVRSAFYWTSERVPDCFGFPGAQIVSVGNGDERCRLLSIGFARFWPLRSP
jgi:hypothetical protein